MFDVQKMGRQIARLRVKNHYTQEQLAEILKISPQAVSKWENGKAAPELPVLCEIADLFHCSIDSLLCRVPYILLNTDFDYEFLVKPRVPAADYSGPAWPKSIASAALLTAVKLFFGLEQRRDGKNRQIRDDEEYILQAAITNICFGYSYAPDIWPHDSFLLYGLDYELHPRADYSEDAFISLARKQIEHGYPAVVIPQEYSDTIFAVGFSDRGRVLKGWGFLDGDDQKNAGLDFERPESYAGWYKADCDLLVIRPSDEKMPLAEACRNALFKGIALLSNNSHSGEEKMRGCGLVMYRNWCDLLREENRKNVGQMDIAFPHAFIHYENKLRTKQFFELCIHILPGLDPEWMTLAIRQYEEIVSFAADIAAIAHQRDTFSGSVLCEKRNQVIEMLRRSGELEELALSYIRRAAADIQR